MEPIKQTQEKLLTAIRIELEKIDGLSNIENDVIVSGVVKKLADAFEIIGDYEDDEDDGDEDNK